jgi:hypothetical protein
VRSLKKEVLAVPTLVFWAGDDTTVPYGKVKDLLDYFVAKEVVLFDQVVTEGREPWEAHTPELIKVQQFSLSVCLSSLNADVCCSSPCTARRWKNSRAMSRLGSPHKSPANT